MHFGEAVLSATSVAGSPSGQRFGVDDLKGVIAVPPTPALPGADRLNARDTVDLVETERMIRTLLDSGVDGILSNGTLGEIATLTLDEWKAFAATIAETVRAVNSDFPVFIGATTPNSRDTADRIRYIHGLGLRGAFLGRPSWSQLGAEAMATYYEDLAAEFPDMAFVLYDNPEAFKGPIPPPVYARLARIPGVIGVKYPSMTPKFRSDVGAAAAGALRIMPIEADWLAARTLFPEEMLACWSSSALCGPEPVLFLREALRSEDTETARWVTDRIEWTYETFLARRDFAEFSKYNTRIEKLRFDEAGYVSAGPARPPYHIVPEEYVEGARETGRRWRQVVAEVESRREGSAAAAVGQSPDQAKEER
jgi:dihydrodipicolinate synthase/N-acetylneuraminate lyase